MQGEKKIMTLSRRLILFCYGRKILFHRITPPKAPLKLKLFLNGKEYCVFLSPEPKVEVVKFSESFYPSRPIRNYRTKQSNC